MSTENAILSGLFYKLGTKSTLIPRYTVPDWFECDLLRISESGYADEFEIKTSRADYLKDFEKSVEVRQPLPGSVFSYRTHETEKKHDLLKAKSPRAMNRFWFVLPADMVVDVPDYAGVMTWHMNRYGGVYTTVQRKAPWIHRNKDRVDATKLHQTFYYRFWNLHCRTYKRPAHD